MRHSGATALAGAALIAFAVLFAAAGARRLPAIQQGGFLYLIIRMGVSLIMRECACNHLPHGSTGVWSDRNGAQLDSCTVARRIRQCGGMKSEVESGPSSSFRPLDGSVICPLRDWLYGAPGSRSFNVASAVSNILLSASPEQSSGRLYPATMQHTAIKMRTLVTTTTRIRTSRRSHIAYATDRRRYPAPGSRRLLDVGCGAGYHMVDMRRLGWMLHGVDFSPWAV